MFHITTLRRTTYLCLIMACNTTSALADSTSSPDDHAPIGVMRDHVHDKGEFMLSYRLGYMHMESNRDGTSALSNSQVLNNYMVSPTEMSMWMHMLGAMYGITDKLTLSAMTAFTDKEMDHVRRNGTNFTMENDGFADSTLNALYEFYNENHHRIQFNAGISLPTGSTNDRNSGGNIFAYPMQMGSGTYDLLPGISYSGSADIWSWGAQLNATVRTGKNNRGYRLGNRYQLTGWVAQKLNEMFSVSLRLDGHAWENVNGTDRELRGPTFMAPPMDANLQAGERLDTLLGINFIVPSGPLKGNRLAVEMGMPIYQRLDGPQLETDYRFTLGWQLAF